MTRPSRLRPLSLAALIAAGPALAAGKEDAPRPRPITPPPAARPAQSAAPRAPLGLASRPVLGLPPPLAGGAALSAGDLASSGLASGGLRSNLPTVGDAAGQCRTTCTHVRLTCDAQDSGPDCAPRWATCVAGCALVPGAD